MTILNIYPVLAPKIEDKIIKEIKITVNESVKEIFLSNNTKSLARCCECLVDIHNTVNKDDKPITYMKKILNTYNRISQSDFNK